MQKSGQKSIYRILTPILFLVGILFFTFLSRVVFSPLLVQIEEELHLSHAKSGSLFLLISIGFAPVMLGSGFVSQRITHRGAILLASITCGLAVLIIAFSRSLIGIQIGMIVPRHGIWTLFSVGNGDDDPSGRSRALGESDFAA